MPEVTVLMSVCNGARFLREAIESVLSQTLRDFEFLIVDDGSTDDTPGILRSYRDRRITIITNDGNLGLARSLNRGLRLSRSELIARLDADDVSERNRLAKQVAFMNAHPEIGLLGSWCRETDEDGRRIGRLRLPCNHADLCWSLLFYCPFVHSAAMFRRSAVDRIGPYDESFCYSMDFEMWRRISNVMRVANLDEYLVRWRTNSASMTATYGDKALEGHRLRLSTLTEWLGWDARDKVANEKRFLILSSLAIKPQFPLTAQEVEWGIVELIRLHEFFSDRFNIGSATRADHRGYLARCIVRQLIRVAGLYPDHRRRKRIFNAGMQAFRRHWRMLSRSERSSVAFASCLGPLASRVLRLARGFRASNE